MVNLNVPTPISHTMSRAKSLLKRDETVRALDALISGLEAYTQQKFSSKIRFEIEVSIQECVNELNRQPAVRELFQTITNSKTAALVYMPKQEGRLLGVLRILSKALHESIAAKERKEEEAGTKRKCGLEQKGLAHLKAGDFPRGKASLRVLAEEFGQEPGVLSQVGAWLLEYKLYFEAAEMFEMAIQAFPKEGKPYIMAAQCYKAMREFEKCETIYNKALKQFGRHPRTLLNLAKLYMDWNKKELAFQAAMDAYKKDNSLEEAKAIVDKLA